MRKRRSQSPSFTVQVKMSSISRRGGCGKLFLEEFGLAPSLVHGSYLIPKSPNHILWSHNRFPSFLISLNLSLDNLSKSQPKNLWPVLVWH